MKRQLRVGTTPELALRRELHRRGLRYRVDYRPDVPGLRSRPDVVFTKARVAVFVDGCFWHGCPAHATQPRHNADWWREKLSSNEQRDHRINLCLEESGWVVVRVWEHEDSVVAADRVQAAVESRR